MNYREKASELAVELEAEREKVHRLRVALSLHPNPWTGSMSDWETWRIQHKEAALRETEDSV